MESSNVIRCMLLPLTNDWLLLPNVTVAEVIAYVEPKNLSDAEPVIGNIDWRGVIVPVVSFENTCGLESRENSLRDRIAILYNPQGDEKKPYLGVKLTDIPKSFRAEENLLVEETISIQRTDLILNEISDEGRRVFIPNLEAMFQTL